MAAFLLPARYTIVKKQSENYMRHSLASAFLTCILAAACTGAHAQAAEQPEAALTPAQQEELTAPAPFAYPSSALLARPTYTVSPATPVKLGGTLVVLERSLLSDVAQITKAPIQTDQQDGMQRQWICVLGEHDHQPIRLWFISSADGKVTEAQMQVGSFEAQQQFCGRLPLHFHPVSLSLISIGDYVGAVEQTIGPASLKDEGWNYWVSRRQYDFDGKIQTEFVWVGAHVGPDGRIERVFSSQLTR